MGLALADDGGVATLGDKLWDNDHQALNTTAISLTPDELIASLSRLFISSSNSSTERDEASSSMHGHENQAGTSQPPRHAPPACPLDAEDDPTVNVRPANRPRRRGKRDQDYLQTLHRINGHLLRFLDVLPHPEEHIAVSLSSSDSSTYRRLISQVEHQLSVHRPFCDQMALRDDAEIQAKREMVVNNIDRLEARIAGWKAIIPSQGPVHYDCSMCSLSLWLSLHN